MHRRFWRHNREFGEIQRSNGFQANKLQVCQIRQLIHLIIALHQADQILKLPESTNIWSPPPSTRVVGLDPDKFWVQKKMCAWNAQCLSGPDPCRRFLYLCIPPACIHVSQGVTNQEICQVCKLLITWADVSRLLRKPVRIFLRLIKKKTVGQTIQGSRLEKGFPDLSEYKSNET